MTTAVATQDQAPPRLPTIVAGGRVAAIVPQDFDSAWRIANVICKSGMAPKGLETVEKSMVAIMHGLEVGLTPMNALQSIAVVNGRPTVWGDGAIGLVRASGLCEWIEEFEEEREGVLTAVCRTKRRNEAKPIERTFSEAEQKLANLTGKDIHRLYPKRMRQMRARAYCLRDAYADVLKGLAIREEVEDYHDAKAQAEQPPAPPPVAQIEAKAAEPVVEVSGTVEELVLAGNSQPAETVEWTEESTEQEEASPPTPSVEEEQPPVPPADPEPAKQQEPSVALHADEKTAARAAFLTLASDFPGDIPMAKSNDDGLDIPAGLRRTPDNKLPQKYAEPASVAEWLDSIKNALTTVESTEQLAEVQAKYQFPMKGKVSKMEWAQSQTLVMDAFNRVSADDEDQG